MFPDSRPQSSPTQDNYEALCGEFVGETRSQLSTLTGEIALRNRVIMENDAYIYGDLLERMLDVPIGHDKTPVNWLRRTVEIHRNQTMGKGFLVTSSFRELDIDENAQPQDQQMLQLENDKRKATAEGRRQIIDAIRRDNMDESLWARMAENASAVGNSILKAWFDPDKKKYVLSMVEAVEHIYAIWSRDDFRSYDAVAYVYQVSKQEAQRTYGVGPEVATSPLGMPLAVLSSANTIEYISTQPMVTIMEVQGRIQGWKTNKRHQLERCQLGEETEMNVVIVGHRVYAIIDHPKYMPEYYIFPNKLVRRRPWGLSDVSKAAININITYIETLSDWRTVANKVNFPKFKGFGFGPGVTIPKPKPRTIEVLPLAAGQDVQPLENPNTTLGGENDFMHQMAELKEQFVREVGIGNMLFDNPDSDPRSGAAANQAKGSISDLVDAKRQLWKPIIAKVFTDALKKLAMWDDAIKELVESDSDWYLAVQFPSSLNVEDPVYQTMLLNRLNSNTISLQTFLEKQGEGREELNRIKSELKDKILAVIHGHQVGLLAELGIMPPPTAMPPKVNVNLRGDLTPEQETNLSVMHQFGNGPVYGPTSGPQGEQGMRANDDFVNQGMITGTGYNTGLPVNKDSQGQTIPNASPNGAAPYDPNLPGPSPQSVNPNPGQQGQPGTPPQHPQLITPTTNNQPGTQPMSQPGSGATRTSAGGKLRQANQRRGQ